MSALPPKATAKADFRKTPCLLYPRKRIRPPQWLFGCPFKNPPPKGVEKLWAISVRTLKTGASSNYINDHAARSTDRKPGSTLGCRVTQLVQRECSAVPSKKQLKPLTQVLPDMRIIPRLSSCRVWIKKGRGYYRQECSSRYSRQALRYSPGSICQNNKNKPVAYYDEKITACCKICASTSSRCGQSFCE